MERADRFPSPGLRASAAVRGARDSEGRRQLQLELEHVHHARQDERAKGVVDLLGRKVLVLLADPPVHEADEGADQEANDGLELEGIERSRYMEPRQLGPRELLEPPR